MIYDCDLGFILSYPGLGIHTAISIFMNNMLSQCTLDRFDALWNDSHTYDILVHICI
jgi:hypothetical protein